MAMFHSLWNGSATGLERGRVPRPSGTVGRLGKQALAARRNRPFPSAAAPRLRPRI